MANWKERKKWVIEWTHVVSDGTRRHAYPVYPLMQHVPRRITRRDGWGRAGASKTYTQALHVLLSLARDEPTLTQYYHWRMRNKKTGEIIPLEAFVNDTKVP